MNIIYLTSAFLALFTNTVIELCNSCLKLTAFLNFRTISIKMP